MARLCSLMHEVSATETQGSGVALTAVGWDLLVSDTSCWPGHLPTWPLNVAASASSHHGGWVPRARVPESGREAASPLMTACPDSRGGAVDGSSQQECQSPLQAEHGGWEILKRSLPKGSWENQFCLFTQQRLLTPH